MSVWVSPDPILEDYLGGKRSRLGVYTPKNLALYAYAHQNPAYYGDADGNEVTASKEISHSNGQKIIDYVIKFSGQMTNDSSRSMSREQLESAASRMKSQIEASFSGSDTKRSWFGRETLVRWKAEADIKVGSEGESLGSRHRISIRDGDFFSNPGVIGNVNEIGGGEINLNQRIIDAKPSDKGNVSFERTAAHEFGHAAGLLHESGELMSQTRKSDSLRSTRGQVETIYKKYQRGDLNQGLE